MPFKDLPLETRKQQVKVILQRLAQAYGVKKSALPEVLGNTKNVMNNWIYYGRIPFDQLLTCYEVTGVSIDWLINGKEPEPMSTDDKLDLVLKIKSLQNKVLDDGSEYGLIKQGQPGAIDLLGNKFEKDLKRLFELPLEQADKTGSE